MLFPTPVSAQWLANFIDANLLGNIHNQALGINEIHNVTAGDICFVDHPKYYETCLQSAATFIIINTENVAIPDGKTLLVAENPFEAYERIVQHFKPNTFQSVAIHSSVKIGKNTIIMPQVFLGENVVIGDNCVIHPMAVIYDNTIIENDVIIHAGCIIGSDAFYYNTKKDRALWYKKMTSCGNVIIKNKVEIGANCTIDRGVSAATTIDEGTKMDNGVHIGHDCSIGKNCIISAHVVLGGFVNIKDGVYLGGQVAISKTLVIEDNVAVLPQSGLINGTEKNKSYWGSPAQETMMHKRDLIWIKRIPEIWKKVMG